MIQTTDFSPQNTVSAAGTMALAQQCYLPVLVNHVNRSWCIAEGLAAIRSVDNLDHELLYASTRLHDIGVSAEFDNYSLPYEQAGGHTETALTAGSGWSKGRRQRVHDVVERHSWVFVDPPLSSEGHLLEAVTALDAIGANLNSLPKTLLEEVTLESPRGTLSQEFSGRGDSLSNQETRHCCGTPSRERPRWIDAVPSTEGHIHILVNLGICMKYCRSVRLDQIGR